MNKYFKKLSLPYLVWLIVLAIVPMLIMLVLIFLDGEGVDFASSSLSLISFKQLTYSSVLLAILNSLLYASITTVISAFIGYVVAYMIFRSHLKNKFLVLTLLILPMWSNILLRINALKSIMEPHNIITSFMGYIGINVTGVQLSGTPFAIILGLVSTYCPFMILTIYTALEKIEHSLEEASLDLGLTEFKTFWKVVFPLSFKGIVTGSIMVFLPCMSGFAIPEILGQGKVVLIGNVIDQLYRNMDYNAGSLLAILVLIVIMASIVIATKLDKDGDLLV